VAEFVKHLEDKFQYKADYVLANQYVVFLAFSLSSSYLIFFHRYKDDDKKKTHVSEHADDEATIDQTRSIFSLSVGRTRDFVLRFKPLKPKARKENRRAFIGTLPKRMAVLSLPLSHGMILEMHPGIMCVCVCVLRSDGVWRCVTRSMVLGCQDVLSHQVPIERPTLRVLRDRTGSARVNLTARCRVKKSRS
jgi:hypothetical protein